MPENMAIGKFWDFFTPENMTIGKFWDVFHAREYDPR